MADNELRVEMINNSKLSVENDTTAIENIDLQIAELTSQKDECDLMLQEIENKLDVYLETKRAALEISLGETVYLEYTDIEDPKSWQMYTEDPPDPPVVVYSKTVNWDTDSQIIEYENDWDYIDGLLNDPLSATDGTYGINATLSLVNNAKSTLQANVTKLTDLPDVFRRNI